MKSLYIFVIVMIALFSGCLQKELSTTGPSEPLPTQPSTQTNEGSVRIPMEFTIYQDYIETLRGRQGISDTGTIEATVVSINRTEVCPYQEEICSIKPYPKDIGIVRIDKIINYTPYSGQSESVTEQPSKGISSENGTTSPGYKGTEYPSKPKPEYVILKEGQEVQTLFLLTVRLAKTRYIGISESEDGRESSQLPAENTTISQKTGPGNKIFSPIPTEGNYFVFTTKVGEFPEMVEKILPGLEVGSRFRAEIHYDGILYVEEYEVKNEVGR